MRPDFQWRLSSRNPRRRALKTLYMFSGQLSRRRRLSLPLFIRQVSRPQAECARFLSQCVKRKFEMEDNQKIPLLVGMNERAMDVACAGPLLLPVCRRQAIVLHGGAKHLFDAAEQRS
jgi:hypothetical protein